MEFLAELAVLEEGLTGIRNWYIGLTDLGREGQWMWIHNQADLDDAMWASNRPNNKSKNRDDCVVMMLNNSFVYWEDTRWAWIFSYGTVIGKFSSKFADFQLYGGTSIDK